MLFKKGELELLWPFYLDAIIAPLFYFIPAFYVIYFYSLGLTYFQIGLLLAIWPLSMFLFEIPTGAVADLYGRKFSTLLGLSLQILGYIGMYFITDYFLMLFLFAWIGFGATFISGAFEAWPIDLIKSKKKKYQHDFFVKIRSFENLPLILSGVLGAFLIKLFGLSIIWIFASFVMLISIFFLSFAKEHTVHKKINLKKSYRQIGTQIKEAIAYSHSHQVLYYFILAMGLFLLAFDFAGSLAWIAFLNNLGLPDYAFGYLWSIIGVVGFIAPFIGKLFYRENKEYQFIFISLLIWSLLLFLIFFIKYIILAFVLFIFLEFFLVISKPVERTYFHKFIPTKIRASIGSVESMVLSLVAIFSTPIVGLFIDYFGPQMTIFTGGFIGVAGLFVFSRIKE